MAARTPESYAGAVELGYDMVRQELLGKIREMIPHANDFRPAPANSRRRPILT